MIGIFDSGIGGLRVVKEVFEKLPLYKVIYFGDLARSPYGTKSPKTVIRFSRQIAHFLVQKGAQVIIIACNTASAHAAEVLKKEFSIPIFEVITPAVKKAIQKTKNQKVGLIGTWSTIESQAYQKSFKRFDPEGKIQLFAQACPLFVPLVEENFIHRPETKKIARYYLRALKHQGIDTLILGCTHYSLLKKVIQNVMGKKVELIDSTEVVDDILAEMAQKNLLSQLNKGFGHQFYFSDVPRNLEVLSQRFLGQKLSHLKQIDLDEVL